MEATVDEAGDDSEELVRISVEAPEEVGASFIVEDEDDAADCGGADALEEIPTVGGDALPLAQVA